MPKKSLWKKSVIHLAYLLAAVLFSALISSKQLWSASEPLLGRALMLVVK